ncbi:MAG TPA: FHA domain-containing protein [Myxococcota bacterium]|nr:FHA domain-containing protein [Myxococcota bacterium]
MRRTRARFAALASALGLAAALVSAGAFAGPDAELEFKKVERLYLDDVYPAPEGQRAVELHFRALTRNGGPVKGLRPADVGLWQDDDRVRSETLSVETLAQTGKGVCVVLAIDASGTMRGDAFAKAKEAALAFLERLRPEDRVGVVTFAEDVRVPAGFELSRPETRQAISGLEIDLERSQHTLLYDGAAKALELIRSARGVPRTAFIVLFSDGKDDGSDKTRDAVVARARGAGDEPHILLFSLGYARFGGEGLVEMKRLADEAGGDFQQAESMVHLRDFFDAIATQMQESYVVRFPASLDGAEHALRLEVDEKSAQRSAVYPSLARPLWPWLAASGAALALVAVVLAVRARRPGGRIAILSGAKAGTVFALQPGRTRIGALEDNDIVLLSNAVSRYHAEIITRGRRASIADLRSKNGTRVNGQVIQESPLRAGDRIAIADVELLYDA